MTVASVLEVRRDDLRTTRVVEELLVTGTGQVLLRVERFGLTANNVTYAVTGDRLGYWGFFPADEGWGRVPGWGFAEVLEGEVATLPVGSRVFGYLPMATHLLVEPARVGDLGFTDAAAHRAPLPAVYNRYQRAESDPLHLPDAENLQAVLAPLVVTAFVLADALAEQGFLGARQVLLSSASSKTAMATALCMRRYEHPRLVGLTSPSRVDAVTRLGCYDHVLGYEELDTLAEVPTVLVDVAGDARLRAAVHHRLADALHADWAVGVTHWEAGGPRDGHLPGPAPQLFFAPTHVQQRVAAWGQAGYQERLGGAWAGVVATLGPRLDVVEVEGLDAARAAYLDLLDGRTRPDEAAVVVPGVP